jgi:hypothetical protein
MTYEDLLVNNSSTNHSFYGFDNKLVGREILLETLTVTEEWLSNSGA